MRFFGGFASHSGRKAARLLPGAGSDADVTRPEPIAEVLPFVDDGALGKVGQQRRQLAPHLLTEFRVEEELVFSAEDLVDLVANPQLVLDIRFGDERVGDGRTGSGDSRRRRGTGRNPRVANRHEVLYEIVLAEKLQIAEPLALAGGSQERLDETALEGGRDVDDRLGGSGGYDGGGGAGFFVETVEQTTR